MLEYFAYVKYGYEKQSAVVYSITIDISEGCTHMTTDIIDGFSNTLYMSNMDVRSNLHGLGLEVDPFAPSILFWET